MSTSLQISGEVSRIIPAGIFDFSMQDDFRRIIDETISNKKIKHIIVDMTEVTFIDSSAIRLLLFLNKKAAAGGKSLTVTNCRSGIREIFSIGGFDTILTIR